MPLRSAADFYAAQQRRTLATLVATRAEWAKLSKLADFDKIGTRLLAIITAAQLGAATDGANYVPAALQEQGQPHGSALKVAPASLSGWATDLNEPEVYWPLQGLLELVPQKAAELSLAEQLAWGGSFLDTIVHSQIADAGRLASGLAIAARPNVGWVRHVRPPCCQNCAILAGKWFRHNQGFQRHHNCFPAGVVASGPSIEAATRRWYQGELVVLTTASGQHLALTGNHPVLTSRGWIPAHLLSEGDEVVRSTRPQGASALVVPNHDQVPTLVEDVWGSLGVHGFDRVPSAPEDFHGDGQYGEIDVVWADGSLRGGWDAPLSEEARHLLFTSGGDLALQFVAQRTSEHIDLWRTTSPGRTVCGSGLEPALLWGHLLHASDPSFAHVAAVDASLNEHARDWTPGDSVLTAERIFAGASEVLANDLLGREVEHLPRWDAPGDPFTMQSRDGYARAGGDLLQRLAGQVEPDRVIEVRRVEWSGHVYSLTSSEGWHSANSLIVSNCDCIHVPCTSAGIPDGYTDRPSLDQIHDLTEAQRKAVEHGADLNQVVNAYRDATPSQRTKMGRTLEGTTRRGYASYLRRAMDRQRGVTTVETVSRSKGVRNVTRTGVRLTPDGIYRVARNDTELRQLLIEHGYVVGDINALAKSALAATL